MTREDAEIAEALANCLRREGIEIQLNAAIEQVRKFSDGQVGIAFRTPKGKQEWTRSHLLVAMGRSPVTQDLDLPAAGVETNPKGFIKVNDRLETNVPGISAIGDVSGGPPNSPTRPSTIFGFFETKFSGTVRAPGVIVRAFHPFHRS